MIDRIEKDPHPIIVAHTQYLGAMDILHRSFANSGYNPRCISILGPSGSGKTALIDKFKIEIERNFGGDGRKPLAVVETPSALTVRAIASSVLESLGDPIYDKGTELQMTNRILNFVNDLETRMILFDEMQNIVDRDSQKLNHKVADWFKRLLNHRKFKIPIGFLGLEQTRSIFNTNEQLRRRFTRPYILQPFDWENAKERLNLKGFLYQLECEISLEPGLSLCENDIAFRFYCASGGLVGYIMKIIYEAQELASELIEPIISMKILAEAYANVVCDSDIIGINPFSEVSNENMRKALRAVAPSEITMKMVGKSRVKPTKD